jgi:hypothetical protein
MISVMISLAVTFAVVNQANAESFVRVLSDRAPVRTGPEAQYRTVYFAPRGEVLSVLERGSRDYWFRVKLEDGTTGWIFGEFVFPFDVGSSQPAGFFTRVGRSISNALLGPSPVTRASTELSFSAGVLDGEGVFMLRPQWVMSPLVSMEAFVGLSPRSDKTLLLAGTGPVLRLAPGAPLSPFVHVGIGAANIRPKADNFVDQRETLMALVAGGGLEMTFKKQITARIDVRNWTFFDNNRANNGLEISAGLAIFF